MFYKGGVYLAIGDSTIWTNTDSSVGTLDIYTNKVASNIRNNFAPVKYLNKGIGGQDSSEIVSNLYWNGRIIPDLLTIGIGMNDCASQAISITAFESNLNTIIDHFKMCNPEIKIILCTPSTTNEATRTPYIGNYRQKMADVAAAKNVSICHFENGWTVEQVGTYCVADGIHPNKVGHAVLANLLWSVIQSEASDWLNSLGN